jgi:hypothetical protein
MSMRRYGTANDQKVDTSAPDTAEEEPIRSTAAREEQPLLSDADRERLQREQFGSGA